jgi:hypothetical protein
MREYRVGSAAKVSSVAAPTRLTDPLDQVDYRLAETVDEKEEIYNLRYRAYLREGAIRPSADERVTDRYDDMPNSWVFGVHFHGELHSSIRITVVTPENRVSPSLDVFGDVLHPMLDKGLVLIDSTRFVGDPAKARNFPELPYVTARLGSTAGVHFDADYGLAPVRPEHQAFYRRVFLQETLCEPRLYPGLVKPVGLMTAHYRTVRERVLARYPFLRSSAFERRMLFRRKQELSEPEDVITSFEPASIVPHS